MNGSFICVGNTNTNPADDKYLNANTDKEATILNIKNIPGGLPASEFTNVNFAYFCVPFTDPDCGDVEFPYAQLNWVFSCLTIM